MSFPFQYAFLPSKNHVLPRSADVGRDHIWMGGGLRKYLIKRGWLDKWGIGNIIITGHKNCIGETKKVANVGVLVKNTKRFWHHRLRFDSYLREI